MIGTIKQLALFVKKNRKHCKDSSASLFSESLEAKIIGPKLKRLIEDIIKIVKYITAKPLKSRICEKI